MTSYISKFNFYLMASIGAFFVPILWAFASVCIVVVIDTITGVKSRRLGHVISKLIYYMSAILIGRISELYIDDQIPFVKLCLVVVLIIEVKSIDENFRDTFGFSFVDKMLNAFKYFNRKD